MLRRLGAVTAALAVLGTAVACSQPSEARLVPAGGAYWGMYVPPPEQGTLLSAITGMESSIGRKLDIVFTYHDMSTTDNGALLKADEPQIGRDRILLLSWEAKLWHENREIRWRDIADGKLDATVIDPQAARIKAYGKQVMLGFDGEMERKTASGTPADYVAAYQHIYDRFKELGVTNVDWVWAVTGYSEYRPRWKSYYPGHDYVDWISYDPYNFGPCRDAPWQSFEQTLKPTYDWFQENGFEDKPIVIGEYGTEADPDRPEAKAEWYRGIPAALAKMPNIKALLQWNAVLEDQRGCDFRLEGTGVLEAFAEAGKAPHVNQPLP
ncbi:glycosyl hydrolase [Spongiactinospora sp. TRM90649]|uniref:glycoside hydrolase family 26 protein n=1 Tax=Spongiactinospora sp. TRM90649 TaxID=3031114 RepID=UPI0023F868BE|nr:glycosyl hydrolase [Spongiactinospora sp. TRM90649]MDF5754521.1 glycosyl hydrolase [Spongiactinospora sp. TRM90649]